MKKLSLLLLLILLVVTSCLNRRNTIYYIDSLEGNDRNSGLSKDDAWKTCNNFNGLTLVPGTKILFKGNQEFTGKVILDSLSGQPGKPVVISSYGNGKAVINAGDSSGMEVRFGEYMEIKNLVVKGNGRLKGNNGNGIQLVKCRFCSADSLEVSGFMWSGLHVVGGNNIRISNIYAHDNGFCGIFAESGEKEYGPDGTKFKTLRNLYIGHCIAENNPGCPLIRDNHSGNGILVAGTVKGTIEYCEAMDNGWAMPREGNGPVGIWAYMSDSILIQHCYSHHNKTSLKGKDGGGFDFDGGVTNSVMQYNLSAFNEGAGFGIFQYAGATAWNNNIMRYNISYNDGSKNSRCGIYMWYDPAALPMKNFRAFNNTIVTDKDFAVNFEPGIYEDFSFENNIFMLTRQTMHFIGGNFEGAWFNRNNYWSKTTASSNRQPEVKYDSSPLIADPDIILPQATAGFHADVKDMSRLRYFRLSRNSACIGSGTSITDTGKFDFWNNPVSTNIGVDGFIP